MFHFLKHPLYKDIQEFVDLKFEDNFGGHSNRYLLTLNNNSISDWKEGTNLLVRRPKNNFNLSVQSKKKKNEHSEKNKNEHSKKNKKLLKLKMNPYLFFEDSKVFFFMKYLFANNVLGKVNKKILNFFIG